MTSTEKRNRLMHAGWKFRSEGRCKVRGCTSLVEYWQKPGKRIAILDYITLRPHWPDCGGVTKGREAKTAADRQLGLFGA